MTNSNPSIERLLYERYTYPEWVTIFECTGPTDRRADVIALHLWPSHKLHRIAFEIKRTRADYIHEMDQPDKRAWLEEYFHETYFVTTHGIVSEDEIPDGWGWISLTKKGDKIRKRKIARTREPKQFSEKQVARFIQKLAKDLSRPKHYFYENMWITQKTLDDLVDETLQERIERLKKREERIRKQNFIIKDAKSKLFKPLTHLRDRAKQWFPNLPEEITVDDVEKYIAQIEQNRFRSVTLQLEQTRNMLDKLIVDIKKPRKIRKVKK